MRLLKVEIDRFASRRLVRWTLLAAVLGVLVLALAGWWGARPPSAGEIADAKNYVQQQKQDWIDNGAEYIKECVDSGGGDEATCRAESEPHPTVDDFLMTRGTLANDGVRATGTAALLVVALALVLGAAFVCAEITSGALGMWLTFEPRRGRVYATKIGAVMLGGAAVTAVVMAVAVASEWTAYALWGRASASGHVWCQLAAEVGRTVAAAALLAALGAALGFLVKHTAAVLGVVAGWLGIVDAALLVGALSQHRWTTYLSVQAWIDGGATYSTEKCTVSDGGMMCDYVQHHLSTVHGGLLLLVIGVVVAGLGWLVFRRRDVS